MIAATAAQRVNQREQTMRLAGKTALITGAGSGIGRTTALLFAKEGAAVALVDRNGSGAEETAHAVAAQGGKAIAIAADVSRSEDCAAMVATAERAVGPITVLFNNAAIFHADDGGPEETTPEVWDETLAINLKGVFLGCKHGIPSLKRAGGGSIINMGSFVGIVGSATAQIAYTASKGGVIAMTREIAVLYGRQNIRANALCPGPIRTPQSAVLFDTPEKLARRRIHMPTGRFGEAAEVAPVALFLASDESSHVTGATLLVDGGITAAYVTAEED